ncbi:MAG: class I SAM-dependent methyltransferase [candidate division NC10 bacterium]|nr:class I SAM-dependent methyltransferase [candidate division NC10 bacterium]
MLAKFNGKHERHVADRKRALLGDLSGDVLEIGPGTGVNLPYYPSGIRWIGIEPNPFMHPYLKRQAEQLGIQVEIREGRAERLDVPDHSMDAVVSTLVLCSVQVVPGALGEILRVLKPGGRFVFIEHVAAPPGMWLRRVPRWVRPVSRALADGCCPDRETWVAIEKGGFEHLTLEHFRVPIPITSPHIAGSATKKA